MPGASGELVLEWARRADAGPFSSVGVLERVVYDSYDPFAALAAAAAATSRVRLATMIAIGPFRSTALLAKQAASVHALPAGGSRSGSRSGRARRLRRGRSRAQGPRRASASSWRTSAATWTATASALARRNRDPRRRAQRPGVLADGTVADGYAHNGGPPRAFANAAGRALAAWGDLGRPGKPKLWGQGYFAFGDPDRGGDYLLDYYAFTGPFAEKIAAGNLTSARAVKDYVRGYEEAGCDELVLFPTVAEIEELERLQEALA